MTNNQQLLRLNKFIAQSGYCSRRAADELIASKKILVNGVPVTQLGTKVDPEKDRVQIRKGPILALKKEKILLMLHKPKGFVCTKSDKHAKRTVYDLLPQEFQHLKSIGRLDKDTEGLLLFTNDGQFSEQLAHPRFGKQKTYRVTVKGKVTEAHQKKLSSGMRLKDYRVRPATVKKFHYDSEKNQTTLELTITEGKNRQIHNMFLALKLSVKKLVRLSVGSFKLGKLPVQQFKLLPFPAAKKTI